VAAADGPEAADDDVVSVGVEEVGLGIRLQERDGVVLGALAGQVEHWLGEVETSRGSGSHGGGCGQGGDPAAATDVEQVLARGEAGGSEERLRDGGEHGVAPVGVGDPAVAALTVPGVLLSLVRAGHRACRARRPGESRSRRCPRV
jgi:hypothetical protein